MPDEALAVLALHRGEVALAGAEPVAPIAGAGHLDVDLAPRTIGLLVGRAVTERVLAADLRNHLVVDAVELVRFDRKERLPAGDLGHLLQQHTLLVTPGCRLVLERADRIDGDVGRPEQLRQFPEAEGAAGIAA